MFKQLSLLWSRRLLPHCAVLSFVCGGSGLLDPSSPDLTGTVEGVTGPVGTQLSILVNGVAGSASRRVVVHISSRRPVFVQRPSGSLRRTSWESVAVGASVQVWGTGVESRSLPPQWDALQIVVLPDTETRN